MDEYARLATTGAGNDECRFCRCGYGLTLRVIKIFEDGGDVHLEQKCSASLVGESARV